MAPIAAKARMSAGAPMRTPDQVRPHGVAAGDHEDDREERPNDDAGDRTRRAERPSCLARLAHVPSGHPDVVR
jgi:hypothetical protein